MGRAWTISSAACASGGERLDWPAMLEPSPLELERHRSYLLRFALLQLRDQGAAEDAVQETLLAALQGSAAFGGRSAVSAWRCARAWERAGSRQREPEWDLCELAVGKRAACSHRAWTGS